MSTTHQKLSGLERKRTNRQVLSKKSGTYPGEEACTIQGNVPNAQQSPARNREWCPQSLVDTYHHLSLDARYPPATRSYQSYRYTMPTADAHHQSPPPTFDADHNFSPDATTTFHQRLRQGEKNTQPR